MQANIEDLRESLTENKLLDPVALLKNTSSAIGNSAVKFATKRCEVLLSQISQTVEPSNVKQLIQTSMAFISETLSRLESDKEKVTFLLQECPLVDNIFRGVATNTKSL